MPDEVFYTEISLLMVDVNDWAFVYYLQLKKKRGVPCISMSHPLYLSDIS